MSNDCMSFIISLSADKDNFFFIFVAHSSRGCDKGRGMGDVKFGTGIYFPASWPPYSLSRCRLWFHSLILLQSCF